MTAADLIAKWDERDRRYSVRKVSGFAAPLTEAEETAVKMFRRLETQDLHPDEQEIALRAIANWHPPLVSVR